MASSPKNVGNSARPAQKRQSNRFVIFLLLAIAALILHQLGFLARNVPPPIPMKRPQVLPAVPLPDRLPRIALLFLTRGPMPLETIWERFLGLHSTTPTVWKQYFSLYVHPAPGHIYPKESMFYGHTVAQPVKTAWGDHSMVEAERVLLRAALADPLNARFVLLSEDSIPLYAAPAVYIQMLSEGLSRVNACANPSDPRDEQRRNVFRWPQGMAGMGVPQAKWRKSSQWVALTREHAVLVADDTEVNAAFQKECYVKDKERFCVSDEHYIPTLLAVKGKEQECACDGEGLRATWLGNYFHPKTYGKSDASWRVLREELRGGGACAVAAAALEEEAVGSCKAAASLATAGNFGAAQLRDLLGALKVPSMPASCPLFARKIAPDAAEEWLALLQAHAMGDRV